jgi:hypothetical protein
MGIACPFFIGSGHVPVAGAVATGRGHLASGTQQERAEQADDAYCRRSPPE